ncbi:hypothetical protein DFH08DRAFT_865605, partial [Mycena albidolilacea]
MSRADLSRTCAPIAAKQRRRSSENWAAWAPAAMRFTRVALVIYGSTALAPASLATTVLFREDVLWAVVSAERCAIRASVSEAPANPGMGPRCIGHRGMHDSAHVWEGTPMFPPSPFDALLNAQRVFTARSTPLVHQRHPPDDRRMPTPLPPSNDASPAAPSASPRAFVFGARKLQ